MKKNRFFCWLLTLSVLLQLLAMPASAAEEMEIDPSVESGCMTLDAKSPLYGSDQRLKTAQAALLFEVNSGTMMYAWNPDQRVDPASLSKIITCMVVMELCDIQDTVTVTESAMSTLKRGEQTLRLKVGDQYTVDQLLYAMMVGSANDAAVVLAEYAAGSLDTFVAMMNQKAADLGCKDTYFTNVHGLYDELQYSTARDIARMVHTAMQDEQFMEYFSTTAYNLKAIGQEEIKKVETTNHLMTLGTEVYYDRRVTGGRTGVTKDSKRSIVATAESGSLSFIVVVLSCTISLNPETLHISRFGNYEEAKELLSLGFGSNTIYHVLYEGQILTQQEVINGRNHISLSPIRGATVAMPTGTKFEELEIRYTMHDGPLTAPINAGQEVAVVELWLGSVCVASSQVIALNSSQADKGDLLQENRYGADSKAWVVLLIVLILGACVAVGGSVGLRAMRVMQNDRRHRRRRADRRRMR